MAALGSTEEERARARLEAPGGRSGADRDLRRGRGEGARVRAGEDGVRQRRYGTHMKL